MSQEVNFSPDPEMNPELMASSCSGGEPIALQVVDDSMEPEFKKDCIIIIDRNAMIENECYVLASIENGFIFRQLLIDDGKYYIQPLNEAYMHEKREVTFEQLEGKIVQQSSPKGRRKDRKFY